MISACYTNVAIGISFSREQGLLKRTRGTPLPGWAFLLGRIGHATLVALLLVVIVTAAGALVYGVDLPTNGFGILANQNGKSIDFKSIIREIWVFLRFNFILSSDQAI